MFLFAEGGHHTPLIVEFVNHYLGEPVHHFQMAYTRPIWAWLFAKFGTTPEAAFGSAYTVENAIPWYTIMFVIACVLAMILISIFKGKLSEDDPTDGQLTLEAGFLAVKDLAVNVIGESGFRYFPVVATFAVLILVSNLMGMIPLFMPPTESVNVTFALGLASFIYFNYVGIKENGLVKYIAHFTGPKLPWFMLPITGLIFVIEIISTLFRPFTLGIRLFANMFADTQLYSQISGLYPPVTHFGVQFLLLLPLGLFVALVQTLVFTLLSMIYLNLALPHDDHAVHEHENHGRGEAAVAHA
jgi:F-type H+-transporting ATPase subunit a